MKDVEIENATFFGDPGSRERLADQSMNYSGLH